MRESTKIEEDNWIAKNAMYLRKKNIRENGNTKYVYKHCFNYFIK